MPKNSALQHLIVQKILVQPGNSMDAKAQAASVAETWRRMAASLAPIIGVKGVHALYMRSLYLSGAVYPCLAQVEPVADAPFAELELQLAACDLDVAIAAANTLFVNFIELLAASIGESLTEQLLRTACQNVAASAQARQRQQDHYEQ